MKGKDRFENPSRWYDNNKIDLEEIGCKLVSSGSGQETNDRLL
jgi:hypothetical protein